MFMNFDSESFPWRSRTHIHVNTQISKMRISINFSKNVFKINFWQNKIKRKLEDNKKKIVKRYSSKKLLSEYIRNFFSPKKTDFKNIKWKKMQKQYEEKEIKIGNDLQKEHN